MSARIVTPTPETHAATFEFFGEVHVYVERAGIMHATHDGSCLRCGETEEWIAEYTPLLGTITSPGERPGYVTL